MKTSDVAEKLDLDPKTVRRLADEGFIPCRIIPGRKKLYIWNPRQVEEFISGQDEEQEYEVRLPS